MGKYDAYNWYMRKSTEEKYKLHEKHNIKVNKFETSINIQEVYEKEKGYLEKHPPIILPKTLYCEVSETPN